MELMILETLIDQVRIPPQTGNYKVYIIDEVHMLSGQAFNAFLKTLGGTSEICHFYFSHY